MALVRTFNKPTFKCACFHRIAVKPSLSHKRALFRRTRPQDKDEAKHFQDDRITSRLPQTFSW